MVCFGIFIFWYVIEFLWENEGNFVKIYSDAFNLYLLVAFFFHFFCYLTSLTIVCVMCSDFGRIGNGRMHKYNSTSKLPAENAKK